MINNLFILKRKQTEESWIIYFSPSPWRGKIMDELKFSQKIVETEINRRLFRQKIWIMNYKIIYYARQKKNWIKMLGCRRGQEVNKRQTERASKTKTHVEIIYWWKHFHKIKSSRHDSAKVMICSENGFNRVFVFSKVETATSSICRLSSALVHSFMKI